MISKLVAIIYMFAPIVGFNLYRFVAEPFIHPHPSVHQDWWMRGEAYAGITLLVMYIFIALLFAFSESES